MFSLPLIQRELLVAARAPGTYRLRAGVAAITMLVLVVQLAKPGVAGGANGLRLFGNIHEASLLMLGLVGVFLTADTISRERREGTLDLLFLTPLTAFKLVTAKFGAQLLRILVIWAAIIPPSIVPLLVGGVAPSHILTAIHLEGTIILWSLAGGILASTLIQRQLGAIIGGIGTTALFLWMNWKFLSLRFMNPKSNPTVDSAINLGIVAIVTLLTLALVAQIITRQRETKGEGRRSLWFRQTFLTPIFWRGLFQRTLQQKMDKNPLIWLEYRTAWSRVGRYVMLGFLIIFESYAIVSSDLRSISQFHLLAGMVLLTTMAMTSASSFQREKENGAFELLLVAPFTERTLLEGRLRAVWSYYLPTGIVFAILVVLLSSWTGRMGPYGYAGEVERARNLSALCSIVTIPVAGFFFALRLKHFVTTFVATVAFGLLIPMLLWPSVIAMLGLFDQVLPFAMGGLAPTVMRVIPYALLTLLLHALLISYFWRHSQRILKERRFA